MITSSAEYMLRGLPVISTGSIGGRNEYFDERFWTICDETPKAVAAAVRTAIQSSHDPAAIRLVFVTKVMANRVKLLRSILGRVGGWPGSIEPFVRDWLDISTPYVESPQWGTPRDLLEALL